MNPSRLDVGLGVLLLSGQGAAQQWQTLEIGTVGAAIEVEHSWRRRAPADFDANYGGDQFTVRQPSGLFGRGAEVQVVVRELRSLLDGEADLRRLLDAWYPAGVQQPMTVVTLPGFVHATRTSEVVSRGLKHVVRCDLLVRPGLAYHVLSWADASAAELVASSAAQLVDGFSFPGADTGWGSSEQPTIAQAQVGGVRVRVPFAGSAWQPLPATADALLVLESIDGDERLTVRELVGEGLGAAIAFERGELARWGGEVVSSPVRYEHFAGRAAQVFDASVGGAACRSIVVAGESGRLLIVRYRAPGAIDELRPLREAMLAAMQLLSIEALVQLPPLPTNAPRRVEDRLSAFVASCRTFAGPTGRSPQPVQMLDDQSYIVRSSDRLERLDGNVVELLAEFPAGQNAVGVSFLGQVWVQQPGAWAAYGGKGAGVAPRDAELATAHDDTLWLWRRGPASATVLPPPAIAAGRVWSDGALVRVDGRGAEHEHARLRACVVDGLIANRRGEVALHGFRPRALGDPTGRAVVWRVAADGAIRELGAWRSVVGVAPARDGFVVTGAPLDGAAGIWLFADDAAHDAAGELLIAGDRVQALGQPFERLEFCYQAGGVSSFVRTTLAACRERGRLCQPFAAPDLDAIGTELIATAAAPRDSDELAAVCELADELARLCRGVPFAAGVDELGALFGVARGGDEFVLSTAGRTLLALLTARLVVAGGGEMVAVAEADWRAWSEVRQPAEQTIFALGVTAAAVVAEQLAPSRRGEVGLERLDRARREGLRVLIGVRGEAVRGRLAALWPAAFEPALAAGDVAALTSLLAATPGNTPLRETVYATLADAGAAAALQALAEGQSRGAAAVPVDHVAWLGARASRLGADDVDAARGLCAELQAALGRFPGEVRLVMLLGDVARQAFADDPAQARRCYEWVTAAVPDGPLHDRATRAMRELDGR